MALVVVFQRLLVVFCMLSVVKSTPWSLCCNGDFQYLSCNSRFVDCSSITLPEKTILTLHLGPFTTRLLVTSNVTRVNQVVVSTERQFENLCNSFIHQLKWGAKVKMCDVTTSKPTTTSELTSTSTTITTTTKREQTTTSLTTIGTTSKHGRLCQVCSDDGRSACNSSQYVYCPEQSPYCMNDLIYDRAGRRQTIKRCVSETYCYWDWWIGTQNDQGCNTSSTSNVTDDVCHYCCQTEHGESLPCNVDAIPKQTISFRKHKKGKICEVTDLMTNTVQTKECPDAEPFCMNDVFYDKSMAASGYVAQVYKKCVSESICKGDWWIKSKSRPECLSGDISSVVGENVLCHYCCLSDETRPCNNETRPKQIYDFLTKPTITVPNDIHQCDKNSIMAAIALNDIVTINGTNCPDGKHEYSDAIVTKYCNGTTWKNWKRGLKVIDNCSKLNRFTPIAAFAGTYFTHDGLAGALLGCNNTDISVVAQSCTYGTKVVHIDSNIRDTYIHNVENYYTISW